MNYQELIDDIKSIYEQHTIITGYLDIYVDERPSYIKDVDTIWVLIGNAGIKEINECLIDSDYNVTKPGCYQFNAVLKYEKPDYGEYGRVIGGGYWYIEYIDLTLDHTFEQRERDSKLSELLSDDLPGFF